MQMLNFNDFIKKINSNTELLPSTKKQEQIISGALNNSTLNFSNKEKFSVELAQIVRSDDFIESLSEKIGQPQANETEDDFVKRAKNSMRSLLIKRLE